MSQPLVLSLPGNERLGQQLSEATAGAADRIEARRFPDGETYVRVPPSCAGRDVTLVCTLAHADEKLAAVLFAAAALREMGAGRISLVAPYLGYLRQDRSFKPGEAVTSRYFAALLSGYVDAVVTVDPHLHRFASLAEIYSIPTFVVHSAALLASWIQQTVTQPLLIGPDSESAQWVADVAQRADAPHLVASKVRRGDRNVEVTLPEIDRYRQHTPVLVDDIISTGRTMIETVRQLVASGLRPPVCVGVHAVFSGDACADLRAAGAARVVTTDTIPHPTNAISIVSLLVPALRQSLGLTVCGERVAPALAGR